MVATVFFRLQIDLLLNVFHFLFTLGANRDPKQKIAVYIQLIIWHLRGCPPTPGVAQIAAPIAGGDGNLA